MRKHAAVASLSALAYHKHATRRSSKKLRTSQEQIAYLNDAIAKLEMESHIQAEGEVHKLREANRRLKQQMAEDMKKFKAECDEKVSLQEELDLLEERCAEKSQQVDRLQLALREANGRIKAGAAQRGKESLQETSSSSAPSGNSLPPTGNSVPSGKPVLPSGNSVPSRKPVPPFGNSVPPSGDLVLPSGNSVPCGEPVPPFGNSVPATVDSVPSGNQVLALSNEAGLPASTNGLSFEMGHGTTHHTLHLLLNEVWSWNTTGHVKLEELWQTQVSTEVSIGEHGEPWGIKLHAAPARIARKECEQGVFEAVDIAVQLHTTMSRSKHPLKVYCSNSGERLSTTKHGTPLRKLTSNSWSPFAHGHATGVSQSSHTTGNRVLAGVGPDKSNQLKEGPCRSEDCFVCLTVTPGIGFLNRQEEGGAVLIPEEVFAIKLLPRKQEQEHLKDTILLSNGQKQQQQKEQQKNAALLNNG
eukprot:gene30914-35968_t